MNKSQKDLADELWNRRPKFRLTDKEFVFIRRLQGKKSRRRKLGKRGYAALQGVGARHLGKQDKLVEKLKKDSPKPPDYAAMNRHETNVNPF